MVGLNPRRILVFVPNWVGDAVMSTPALRALRRVFADAQIVALSRPYVGAVFAGLEDLDEVRGLESLKSGSPVWSLLAGARELRAEGFDLAILMTNSFRTAVFALVAGVNERVGYAREGRGLLLTTALRPRKAGLRFEPSPMIDYYLALAAAVGAPSDDRRMRLAVTAEERALAGKILTDSGVDVSRRLAVVNPGAAFGTAKCWPPANFAAVADALAERGFEVLVVAAPRERQIAEAIRAAAARPLKPVWNEEISLGALKGLVADACVVVTNDSGPRHFAAALDVPVVTIMGPTDPRWSDTGYRKEVILNRHVDCAPCMERVCRRDHRCMELITPAEVVTAVDEALGAGVAGEVAGT